MIIDNELVLSEELSLIAAGSTTGILTGGLALESKAAKIRCTVTTAGAGTGTTSISAEGSNTLGSGYVTLATSQAFAGTACVKGKVISVAIPANDYVYLRATVVVSGTLTAAKGFIDVEVG